MAKKIVLDSGHGGEDPGTIANGIIEKDLTLKISQYMHNRLNELGIDTELSRNSDETLSPSIRPERIQNLYGTGSDVIVISNHINAGGGDGAEVIYALRNSDRLSSIISDNLSAAGQNVRKYYQRRLPSNPDLDYYYIMRDTPNNETIIVEYGFADSTGDDVNQLKNNWQDLAEAVVKSLATYVGVSYTPVADGGDYIVKAGDTLWTIAKNNGLTVAKLKAINNLTSNSLSIGQVLKLKRDTTTSNGDNYTVKSGDTLYAIAKKFNLTVDQLKAINNLTTNNLSIGQVLKITISDTGPEEGIYYIVKSGDSLYKIANMFNITVNELKSLNNLSSNLLSIGQRLKVPGNQNENEIYIVQSGDTLYSIARKYNTTVTAIQSLNNLVTSSLSIGQQLLIPN